MKIIWLPLARLDLENIFTFQSSKSEISAINLFNDILDAIEPLRQFPQMAQIEPALSPSIPIYRSLVVKKNYKIIYYIELETIYISAIWDCRKNPEKLQKRK